MTSSRSAFVTVRTHSRDWAKVQKGGAISSMSLGPPPSLLLPWRDAGHGPGRTGSIGLSGTTRAGSREAYEQVWLVRRPCQLWTGVRVWFAATFEAVQQWPEQLEDEQINVS